ncbi:hypothetical protein OOZ15_16620 [Galbibacter sp. EGI 63066]|uniref:M56 family metallopeptidase n=1 Tax=Galbibacter sp. EGI 63066 TaxID=2993559 RepID=UPI0022498E6E|nr:M56 family metallopeptidase [Galbibacter sp. EGI 63066]MCX2681580.1 hypothetical protein [Galbibacter sp. EGI 63066]
MEDFFTYLLKSYGVLLIFWLIYTLFLKKETFFVQNRWFLLSGLAFSILFPLIYFEKTALIEIQPELSFSNTPINSAVENQGFDFIKAIFYIHIIGVLFFLSRLGIQLISLYRFIKKGKTIQKASIKHVHVSKKVSPFSFFHYVVYNPDLYSEKELKTILKHEKVHVKQFHSLDVILIHLFAAFFWSNPLVWFYKKDLTQNMEYIADMETAETANSDLKNYQYLLLKQSYGDQFSIINPFFNSLIKKRILMLQKQKSNKVKLLRYALIAPFLLGFMLLFSFKTVTTYKVPSETAQKTAITPHNEQDDDPIYVVDGKVVSKSIMAAIDPKSIDKINVLKGEKAVKKYGEKAKNGVVEIFLKKDSKNTSANTGNGISIKKTSEANTPDALLKKTKLDVKEKLLIIDDKEATEEELSEINPDDIGSVMVLKEAKAIEKYGEEGKNGVIVIKTKSSVKE